MTYEEALTSVMNDGINLGAGDYLPIETLYKCKEALEKQMPKKPIRSEYNGKCWCPSCNSEDEMDIYYTSFCPDCGQALDWSDAE